MAHWPAGRGVDAAVNGIALILALSGCVPLHESGHSLAARKYGIPTRDIALLPAGGAARLERMAEKPSQGLWVALAGPALNGAIAGAPFVWPNVSQGWALQSRMQAASGPLAERLLIANVPPVLFLIEAAIRKKGPGPAAVAGQAQEAAGAS